MYIKLTATLKSPLMIGGKTLNSNYKKSKPYIPGSVLRAAYARTLIDRCVYSHDNYWLSYKDQDECRNCKFQVMCKNFKDISFSTLYPFGGFPYPFTAREEKYERENTSGKKKDVVDILRWRVFEKRKLEDEAKWERLSGIHKNGEKIEVNYSLITRTAVDYRRRSAKTGALYSENVIAENFIDEHKKMTEMRFSGIMKIDDGLKTEFERIKTIHVGADITRGMGHVSMSYEQMDEPDSLEKMMERVNRFNEGNEESYLYIPLDLQTDAYLSLEKMHDDKISLGEISDEEYKKYLEKEIHLPSCYQLEKVYKSQEVQKGFNTAKSSEQNMRREGKVVVLAGAVFLYKVGKKDFQEEILFQIEQEGIGENRVHGFGKVLICDEFHLDYDAIKGEEQNG